METVLVCVSPAASYAEYELLTQQFAGPGWEPYVLPATDLSATELPPIAAAVALATDWPDEKVHEWLLSIRQAIGPRKRLLVLLPRPPHSYPPQTQALWSRAFGYGARISEAVAIVNDFLAGRA